MFLPNQTSVILTWLSVITLGFGLEFNPIERCISGSADQCGSPEGLRAYDDVRSPWVGPSYMLYPEHEYKVSWTGADADYPVRIGWHFWVSGGYTSRFISFVNDTSTLRWDYNVSKGNSYVWSPSDVLKNDFPNKYLDMTGEEAMGPIGLYYWNFLSISQPDSDNDTEMRSDAFTMHCGMVEDFMASEKKLGHEEEFNKWSLGVGIGVGVGVPILLAAAYVMGRRSGCKKGRKERAEKGADGH